MTHFVARGEDRARILAGVDPAAIPPGVLTFVWLNDHASIAVTGHEPLVPFLQPMLDTVSAIDDDFYRLAWSGQLLLLAVLGSVGPTSRSRRRTGDPGCASGRRALVRPPRGPRRDVRP